MTEHEQLADMVRAAPPLTVTTMSLLGFPISDWAFLLTAVYTTLLIVQIVRRMITSRRATDNTCNADCPARKK